LGGLDFSALSFTFVDAEIKYGLFIQSIVNFFIISFSIFLFIRYISKLKKKDAEEEKAAPDPQEELLKEIRDLLKEQTNRS
ncbi:large conductance mechanosensitive channel protein MscL, partial [Bacillus licheniformis]